MMKRAALVLFIACCAVSALSLAEDGKKSKPSATDSPPEEFGNATTTMKTTTTTTKPTTTKPTTTTTKPTTTKPTTTKATTKPPTTTKATTKPPTTTKSTTKPPTTTKTTIPPPPQPTPPTKDSVGNYTLMANKTVICVMAQMVLKIRLAIPKGSGTFVVQPNITKVEGFCKGTTANLTLVFKEGFITFMFNKSAAEDRVYVDTVSFSLTYPLVKDANIQTYNANNKSLHLFEAKVAHSYSCKTESVDMGKGLHLDVFQTRMQAFNLTKSNDFGTPDPCPADKPDYRVAIAVGVTLLVLIIIVVVAYLLGRRRRADGYQSL